MKEDVIERAIEAIAEVLHGRVQDSGCNHSTGGPSRCASLAMDAVAAMRDAGLLPTEAEWGVSRHCHTGCPAGDEHISSEDFGGSEGIARSLVADDPERLALVTRNVTPWKDAS